MGVYLQSSSIRMGVIKGGGGESSILYFGTYEGESSYLYIFVGITGGVCSILYSRVTMGGRGGGGGGGGLWSMMNVSGELAARANNCLLFFCFCC